jgi:hypothetical protein
MIIEKENTSQGSYFLSLCMDFTTSFLLTALFNSLVNHPSKIRELLPDLSEEGYEIVFDTVKKLGDSTSGI